MAGTRPTRAAPKGSQRTLAFSNSKITKPTSSIPSKTSKLSQSPLVKAEAIKSELDSQNIDEIPELDVKNEEVEDVKIKAEDVKIKAEDVKIKPSPLAHLTETEQRALKISDAQIKKYWREREAERKAPRVHQGGLGVEEKVCRLFDMSSQFGPCIGITRQKRWLRAQKLNLNPPIEVLAVLLKEEGKDNKKATIQKAYVDELMNPKLRVTEP